MQFKVISDHLFIWQKDCYKRVAIEDIVIIRADRSYCEIITITNKHYVLSIPMSDVFSKITDTRFIRIHRSHVINIQFIDSLTGNMIGTTNGIKLTIGKAFRKDFFCRFIFIGAKRGIQ